MEPSCKTVGERFNVVNPRELTWFVGKTPRRVVRLDLSLVRVWKGLERIYSIMRGFHLFVLQTPTKSGTVTLPQTDPGCAETIETMNTVVMSGSPFIPPVLSP